MPIAITQSIGIDAEFDVAAKEAVRLEAGVTARAKIGIRYDHGDMSLIREFSLDRHFSMESKGEIGMKVSLPIGYEAALYGVIGMRAQIEPLIRLTVDNKQAKWIVMTAQVDAALKAFLKIDIGVFTFKEEVTLVEATLWGPRESYSRTARSPYISTNPCRRPPTWGFRSSLQCPPGMSTAIRISVGAGFFRAALRSRPSGHGWPGERNHQRYAHEGRRAQVRGRRRHRPP